MATTPGTIKHRKQTALPSAGYDVDVPQWNDSEVMAGGTAGQVCTRDTTQADGWGWGTPTPVNQLQPITTTGAGTIALTAGTTVVKGGNATLLTIQGLSGGVDGQRLTILATGAQIDLKH